MAARATAAQLTTFIVPDLRTARAAGMDVEAAGLRLVATPRHARVLLVIGDLPSSLVEAAAVTYAQMPRPRAILAAGARTTAPLPTPDVTVSLDQASLERGVGELRTKFAVDSWSTDIDPFTVETIQPQEDEGDHEEMDHGGSHGQMDHGSMDHGEMDHGDHEHMDHQGMSHGEMDHGDTGHGRHEHMDHASMGHEGMDHGDMGFMSMVAMTKDLPRDRDGLPMERFEAPFGPLFPGLPAGLRLTATLDGDVVVETKTEIQPVDQATAATLNGPVSTFPSRLARRHRVSPVPYWLLGRAALDTIMASDITDATRRAHIGELERARAASHLGWLAEFSGLLGNGWLSDRAATLHRVTLQIDDNDLDAVRRLRQEARSLIAGFDRLGIVRRRLSGIARLNSDHTTPGPVGRASGCGADTRQSDPLYQSLGFVSISRDEGDAFARLYVRLDEIEQSLDLILAAGTMTLGAPPSPPDLSGTGTATIETPRGTATLDLTVDNGNVTNARLTTPSTRLVEIVSAVTDGAEVADALVGVASLDLSPSEIIAPAEEHR